MPIGRSTVEETPTNGLQPAPFPHQTPRWELTETMLNIGQTNTVIETAINGLESQYVDVQLGRADPASL